MPQIYYRAKLDADRIYWGVEQVPSLTAGDVEVPRDCDLRPGHYRHDLLLQRFEPLARAAKRDTPEAPSLERALYELLKQMDAPPAYSAEWMRWYETTIDARGAK